MGSRVLLGQYLRYGYSKRVTPMGTLNESVPLVDLLYRRGEVNARIRSQTAPDIHPFRW